MIDVCDRICADDDQKITDAIAGSESGKSTLQELATDTGIAWGPLREHLTSMKSRGIVTSYECELNGTIYYKLACG